MKDVLKLPLEVRLTETAMLVSGPLSFEDWQKIGAYLKATHRATQWWIGDYLVGFEAQHGEKYAQCVDPAEAALWQHYAWVARAIPNCLRKQQLSYKHHEAVAPLVMDTEKEIWLTKSVEHGWTTRELREQLIIGGVRKRKAELEAATKKLTEVLTSYPCEGCGNKGASH